MNKLFAFIATKIEGRLLTVLTAAVDKATEEALEMFPTWWENGPNRVADAGAHRLLAGEDPSEDDIEMLVGFTRFNAMSLAVDARSQSAMREVLTKLIPNIAGLRDQLLEPVRTNDDELIVEMRNSVANYGINPEALEMYFAR